MGLEMDLNKGLGEGPARVKEIVEMLGLGLGAGKSIMPVSAQRQKYKGVHVCVWLNLMAFFPHLFHSLAQTVEDGFPCFLPAWRLHTAAQISGNLLCSTSATHSSPSLSYSYVC